MLKKVFNLAAWGVLGAVILNWYRGKRLNPLGLRLLLAIMTALALWLGSAQIVIFAGTWLAFLLMGDVSRTVLGVDIRLFDDRRQAEKNGSAQDEFTPRRIGQPARLKPVFAGTVNLGEPFIPQADRASCFGSALKSLGLKKRLYTHF